jgi:hypothetical protein
LLVRCGLPDEVREDGYDPGAACVVVTVTPGDTELTEGAFSQQSCIRTIILPASIEHIRARAFQGCDGLAEVRFAEDSRLTTIGNSAFAGCARLQQVLIPEGTTICGRSADEWDPLGPFNGCSNLAHVLAPDALVRGEAVDPAWVFKGCPVLADAGITPHSEVPRLRRTLWHPTMHAWCTVAQDACVLAVLVAELRLDRQDEGTALLPSLAHDIWLLILECVPRHRLGRP